jgi:predicted ATPase
LHCHGELVPARAHLEQGIALYDPLQHRSHAFLYGYDPGMMCLSFAAWGLWLLGYPDQALARSHEALTLTQKLAHPHSLANALFFAAVIHQCRREGQAAQERAEAAIALSTAQGFQFVLALVTILRGWALAVQGQEDEGIAQMRQGLAAFRASGAQLLWPYYLTPLIEAYGKAGQAAAALALLAEALTAVHKTGEHVYEAELYRLKGELLLALSQAHQAEAETCLHQALDVARRQQAKSLELRAAMSLSRLWQQQGKCAEARALLAPLYGWFTEGFDTADLQEARTLLEALEGGA